MTVRVSIRKVLTLLVSHKNVFAKGYEQQGMESAIKVLEKMYEKKQRTTLNVVLSELICYKKVRASRLETAGLDTAIKLIEKRFSPSEERTYDEGYLSAMQQNLQLRVEFEHLSPDVMITEFELKKSDFLRFFEPDEIDFIEEDLLTEKALKIWMS